MVMEVEIEDSFVHDSYAIAFVQHALKAAVQGDRDNYDQMVVLMAPSVSVNPDDPTSLESLEDKEALLVATLRALSEVVSHIDVTHHQSLYNSILGMSLWKCQPIVRDALVDLVICLAVSSSAFLDACLDMLVCHFIPPPIDFKRRWPVLKNDVVDRIFSALQDIADLVPVAPMRLLPIIERRMPGRHAPKHVIEMYVECMLKLESSPIGEFIGGSLLKAVVDRLVDLDVDIRWEDILVNDSNRGIFDMELEDTEGTADAWELIKSPHKTRDTLKGNKAAETLDSLMTITCKHLELCANDGRFGKVFETLTESFQKTVLTAYKTKFVQFVMFYACSLKPEISEDFPLRLMYVFVSDKEPLLFRMSAVSYLASYLSRAKFLSSSFVVEILKSLVNWCLEYCQLVDVSERTLNIRDHDAFYFGCQAVMYILCFRMRSIIDNPLLGYQLNHMPLLSIFSHALVPLKVCLPSIVEEFLWQAKAAQLFTTSTTSVFDELLQLEPSKTSGGVQRLDMFFPFDPYILKESDRFIRPHFEFWTMVRTTYDDCYSEDEDDEDTKNRTSLGSNVADLVTAGREELPEDDSEEELGFSMNEMSVTPKNRFIHLEVGNDDNKMPARIRPSTSPV